MMIYKNSILSLIVGEKTLKAELKRKQRTEYFNAEFMKAKTILLKLENQQDYQKALSNKLEKRALEHASTIMYPKELSDFQDKIQISSSFNKAFHQAIVEETGAEVYKLSLDQALIEVTNWFVSKHPSLKKDHIGAETKELDFITNALYENTHALLKEETPLEVKNTAGLSDAAYKDLKMFIEIINEKYESAQNGKLLNMILPGGL